jgi:hypothetical protein
MVKSDIVKSFIENVESVKCEIVKVYGVPMGVGYDMVISLTHKDGHIAFLDAHATRQSWALIGHLRPNQTVYDDYKGSNYSHKYIDSVKSYWESKNGLFEYLLRFKKQNLQNVIDTFWL